MQPQETMVVPVYMATVTCPRAASDTKKRGDSEYKIEIGQRGSPAVRFDILQFFNHKLIDRLITSKNSGSVSEVAYNGGIMELDKHDNEPSRSFKNSHCSWPGKITPSAQGARGFQVKILPVSLL